MDISTRCNVFRVDPLIQLMKDVIPEEVNCEILQTDLTPMEYLVQYITTVLDQLPEAARETLVVWLQLLHIFLTEAKSILHRSDPPQRCLDCLRCNPRRLSKQIKKWRVRFNYLFQALERDFSVFVSGREAVIAPVIAPVIPLMKDVIQDEEDRHILQTGLRHVYWLLLEISVVFDDQQKAAPEALKIWLQLLNNSLTEANSILHDYGPSQRQRRLDCLRCNPRRPSKQIKRWGVRFNYLFQALDRDISVFVSGREAVIAPVIAPVISLMNDVIQEEENYHILQTELRPVDYSYKFQHLEHTHLVGCRHLRELSPLERLPSLKGLFLHACDGLKELGIGFSGRPSGFLMLEKLVLTWLSNLESIAGPLNNDGVWNESTLPKLRILKINVCTKLKRFPMGTDKLLNLSMIAGEKVWWQEIIWEDYDMQVHLEKLFKAEW